MSAPVYGAINDKDAKDSQSESSTSSSQNNKLTERLMLLAFIIIVIDTLVVAGVVYVGWDLYSEIQETASPFAALHDYRNFNHSDNTASPREVETAQVMDRFTSMMSNTGTFFLFGNATSSVAAFVTNLMRYDYKDLATTAETFALALNKTMANSPGCNLTQVWCNTTAPNGVQYGTYDQLTCPPTVGYPSGHTLTWTCYRVNPNWYTPQPSFYETCNRFGCPNEGIQTAASAVASIAKQVKAYDLPAGAQSPGASPASFSNGIFRLDRLLDWTKSQLSVGPWKSMGATCVDFFDQMKGLDWSNCYSYTEGGQTKESCWDLDDEMSAFAERAGGLCKDLTTLGDN